MLNSPAIRQRLARILAGSMVSYGAYRGAVYLSARVIGLPHTPA